MAEFSEYVIYADESGDHSLTHIDEKYPVFVLCLCVFNKKQYVRSVVPRVQNLKFKWFGHDAIILHEKEIRKREKPFEFLNNVELNDEFIADLTSVLESSNLKIVAAAIDKKRLKSDYLFHDNPYHIALSFCIEKIITFLYNRSEIDKIVHFIFERRGLREDKELELEFRRVCDGYNAFRRKLPNFEIVFVDKKANSSGMQLADLTARPIGLSVINPHQTNRAYEIIRRKLLKGRKDNHALKGLRIFP